MPCELTFEQAAAYAVARTLPLEKLYLSIHAKNGTSTLRLMGPGLKVVLDRWCYASTDPPEENIVYNYRLSSRYVKTQLALPDGSRSYLNLVPNGVDLLLRLLLNIETP